MKILTPLVILLAVSALPAQESTRSLDARVQLFVDFVQPKQFTAFYDTSNNAITDKAGSQVGLGFRILGELPYTQGWYYELGGRFESSSSLTYNDGATDASDLQVQYSYWSVGVGYLWNKGPLSVGAHLEGRGEALSLVGELLENSASQDINQSTTVLRPWARGSVDFTIGSGKVRPYVGVEGAFALTRKSQLRASNSFSGSLNSRLIQSAAPDFSVGAYLGLRF